MNKQTVAVLDFGFKINIRGFKKAKLDESKFRQAYAWGGQDQFPRLGKV